MKKLITILLVLAMALTLAPMALAAEEAAAEEIVIDEAIEEPALDGASPRIDFVIQEWGYDQQQQANFSWVQFVQAPDESFLSVNCYSDGRLPYLPTLFRTDSLNYVFDGWYTEKTGGEKVTLDTVFSSYTILYDHWSTRTVDSSKIVKSIHIPNADLPGGQTLIGYINACGTASGTGYTHSKDYAVYHGLNAYGSLLTDSETIDPAQDYSVVTTITLRDGYYFDRNVSITSSNGVRAGYYYIGDAGKTDDWNDLARRVVVCINFPGTLFYYDFTKQPVGGDAVNGEHFYYTWECNEEPNSVNLEMKNENGTWANLGPDTGNTPAYEKCVRHFRLAANFDAGTLYSDEFVVSWADSAENDSEYYTVTFLTDYGTAPAAQTVKSGSTAAKPADPVDPSGEHVFRFWATRSTRYVNGQPRTAYKTFDFDKAVTSDLTLYARWEDAPTTPGGEKPTVTIASDGKTATVTGDWTGLYARVALVLDNNGVSGLYITQATINPDGTILIPEFKVPGLTVKGVNVALVPTLADIQSSTPNAEAMATKMLNT